MFDPTNYSLNFLDMEKYQFFLKSYPHFDVQQLYTKHGKQV